MCLRSYIAVSIALGGAAHGCTFAPTIHGAGIDPSDGSVADANPGDGPVADAAPLGPFGPATVIPALQAPGEEDDPTLTGDLLELYFDSSCDLMRSQRANRSDPWGPPEYVMSLNSTVGCDATPEVSDDGLTIRIASLRGGGPGDWDVWIATRNGRDDEWSAPVLENQLNSTAVDIAAAVDASGRFVILSSERAGGVGGRDLYIASRPSPGDRTIRRRAMVPGRSDCSRWCG